MDLRAGNTGDQMLRMGNVVGRFLDFLLPPRCTACGVRVEGHGLYCADCWAGFDPIGTPACVRCGFPFPVDVAAGEDTLCMTCLARPPHYDWACAGAVYGGMVRGQILRLKYGRGQGGVALARLMAMALRPKLSSVTYPVRLVPVPLHYRRLRMRRFNQAHILARHLGHLTGVEVTPHLLMRRRSTPSQGQFGRKGRLRNVRGAFGVRPGALSHGLSGQCVILVDDVYTTGATVGECARVLRRSGAAQIGVVTAARVVEAAGVEGR
ncbi:ComF family protein [Eilatimonas milleporae]|uniref:ComF family protein n=2 Tax=Eilatimonas milleporae TaxID=911205 RepID=A0A3M0CEQ4_9PROT|nr:ComF family protein [Eilatimonas milleporae]